MQTATETTATKSLSIRPEINHAFIKRRCILCEERFELQRVNVTVQLNGKIAGDICPECVEAGTVTVSWPTPAELEQLNREHAF